uniref:Uncharacterized protein n=1 Tax=Anguilla anguilla TaxID=7936 RepID=A0A0E9QAB6_ANGAN
MMLGWRIWSSSAWCSCLTAVFFVCWSLCIHTHSY